MTPISICVIAKNEEKHMDNFLSAIKKHMRNYPHEVVIVDTGSTDRTVDIARKYTSKVFHFEWINDFSAARNYSIECASFNWILVLDCDEYPVNIRTECFDQMIKQYPRSVGSIQLLNHCWTNGQDRILNGEVPRFFSKKRFHYEDIIHEQLCSIDRQPYDIITLPITVEHFGYSGSAEALQAKAQRNNELLFKALEVTPDDPYLYFQIGQSYNLINDAENACIYFEKALSYDINPEYEYAHQLIQAYGYVLLDLHRYEDALHLESVYDAFGVTPEFSCLMGLIYLNNKQFIPAMREFLKATTYQTAEVDGANTYTPLYNMGYINELLGNKEAAIQLYESCGNHAPALRRLANLKS
ncbi:MAG: glycosyltransferase [Lachnospiraceae bacterium]|nr:glycosyltransferase [Lachnospiraceae bacterium]